MRKSVGILLIGVLILSGFVLSTGDSFGADPIKWGFLDSMSGPFGVFGKANVMGTKFAIKKINDAGGILGRRIELIIEDDEANTEVAARKARRLILKDKVDAIQGAASTAVTAMIMKIAGQYKTLHFNSEFDSATVLASRNDYHFNLTALCEETERARMVALTQIYKPEEIKRWLILYPDYAYGHDMRDVYRRELKRWVPGAEIIAEVKHQFGETDYSTHIVKILEANAQVVVSCQWAGDALNFIRQALPLDFFKKVPIFYFNGASFAAVAPLKDKLPIMWGITEQGNPYLPKMKKFRDEFYEYLGEWPMEENVCTYYDTVFMYKAAVEKAKSTKAEAVAKALVGMQYNGPSGMRKIRKDHQADIDHIPIVKWAKGKEFEWSVPTEVIEIPYNQVKYSGEELIKMGCKWCEGKY